MPIWNHKAQGGSCLKLLSKRNSPSLALIFETVGAKAHKINCYVVRAASRTAQTLNPLNNIYWVDTRLNYNGLPFYLYAERNEVATSEVTYMHINSSDCAHICNAR